MIVEGNQPLRYFVKEKSYISDEVVLTVIRTWLHEREEKYREKFKGS
jgi:hypothetical protein